MDTMYDLSYWNKYVDVLLIVCYLSRNHSHIKSNKRSESEIYNLKLDVSESKNIKGSNVVLEKQLQNAWNRWNQKNIDRIFPTLGEDEWWTKNKN